MTDRHLVQLSVSIPKLSRFFGRMWGKASPGSNDVKFISKTALSEVLVGDAMTRPWRIQHVDEVGEAVILGYSAADAERVRTLIDDALPELAGAFDRTSVFSKPVRRFVAGERLQVQSRICATRQVHVSPTSRREMDAWNADMRKRERHGLAPRDREEVYRDYYAEAMLRGASVSTSRVVGYAIETFARKDGDGVPSKSQRFPVVEMEAICEVVDPDGFRDLLLTGIGRSRVYGCGMILVRAAA